jgi:sterol desaturase/sphingolipid hydroxylase (fatty acid hydroxylase superfamily)
VAVPDGLLRNRLWRCLPARLNVRAFDQRKDNAMPSLVQLVTDPVSLAVFALYAAVVAWEAWRPARALPAVTGWRTRGLLAFAAFFLVSSYLPLAIGDALAPLRLVDLTAWPTWAGALAGVLVYELGVYAWHRAMHRSDTLWRAFHQMHHSAERVDAFGAFWFSPLDMIGWTLLAVLALSIVGLSPAATTATLLATTFLSVFQHANVRTPRWLGFVVQRPESHSRHHERGVHARNYSDLPLFDLLFGTFDNPQDFAAETGFYDGASARVVDMLRGRDVTTAPSSRVGAVVGRAVQPAVRGR